MNTKRTRHFSKLLTSAFLATSLVLPLASCDAKKSSAGKARKTAKATSVDNRKPPKRGTKTPTKLFDPYHSCADSKDKFLKKLGAGAKAIELGFYRATPEEHTPGWITAKVQDPNKLQNVDEYEYKGNTVTGPKPVKLVRRPSSGTVEQALEQMVFPLANVDF